jgi:hypothetical protein
MFMPVQFISLEPFVPSGKDFDASKLLFIDLGFTLNWDAGGYAGFGNGSCKFILQQYDNRAFAENLMLSIRVSDVDLFYKEVVDKKIPEKHGIQISPPMNQPYGRESNIIDRAGVCWHFVQQNASL